MMKGKRIGIDLGGTSVKIGVVNDAGEITERIDLPMDDRPPFQAAVERIANAALALGPVASVGFGVPSTLVPGSQVIIHANNLGWKQCDIKNELKKYMCNTPVYLANDADCAALGEWMQGAARGADSALMLTLGTGIGGSFIHRGRLFLGGNGIGMEPGHMVICHGGLPCTCGKQGCLEAYASASALAQQAAQSDSEGLRFMIRENAGKPTAKMIFDAASAGDMKAQKILDAYIQYLTIGLSNLIALFGPERIIIGGGVSGAGEQLLAPLRRAVYPLVDEAEWVGCPEIVAAALGNDAGIIGAALLDQALL